MIRIHCRDHSEAEAAWRLLMTQTIFDGADIWVSGDYVRTVIRLGDGNWSTLSEALPGRSPLDPAP
jgi:hypothetical protein